MPGPSKSRAKAGLPRRLRWTTDLVSARRLVPWEQHLWDHYLVAKQSITADPLPKLVRVWESKRGSCVEVNGFVLPHLHPPAAAHVVRLLVKFGWENYRLMAEQALAQLDALYGPLTGLPERDRREARFDPEGVRAWRNQDPKGYQRARDSHVERSRALMRRRRESNRGVRFFAVAPSGPETAFRLCVTADLRRPYPGVYAAGAYRVVQTVTTRPEAESLLRRRGVDRPTVL